MRVSDGFQPGGRTPAPAPLDLVQDFVNTEIPDWNRDDVGQPGGARDVAPRASPDRRRTTTSRRSDFVAARALRGRATRARAREHARPRRSQPERQVAVDRALGAFPLALRVGADGPAVGPGGSGAAARARGDRRRRRRGADGRRLGAAEGLPPGDVRLALLRRLAQPLVELVLDADLRRPGEGARVPPPTRADAT